VTWTKPDINGADVLAYYIYFRQSDGITYSTELNTCDGTDATIVSTATCVVDVSYLIAEPFSLPWGSSVYAKIVAENVKGLSTQSNAGNGAVIVTIPDPPINLQENLAQRSVSTLGITWEEAAQNGGTSVIDYRVWRSVSGGAYQVLLTTIQPQLTAVALTPGLYYKFKVESRNQYGYSLESDEIELLCAYIPSVPQDIESTNLNDEVVFQWNLLSDNGSPVTEYKIFIRNHDQDQYIEESVDCVGSAQTTLDTLSCSINLSTLTSEPYNLEFGEQIFAKVTASNYYGESDQSVEGTGAVI
jgi:hypothetical protein